MSKTYASLYKIWSITQPNRKWIYLRFAGAAISAATTIYLALLIARMVDMASGIVPTSQFGSYIALMLIITSIKIASNISNKYTEQKFAYLTQASLRSAFFKHLMHSPVAAFEKQKTGELLTRFSSAQRSVFDFFGLALSNIVYIPVAFLISVYILGAINLKLTIIVFLIPPFCTYLALLLNKTIRKQVYQENQKNAAGNSILYDIILGFQTYKALNLFGYKLKKYDNARQEQIKQSYKVAEKTMWIEVLNEMSYQAMVFFSLLIGGVFVLRNAITIGDLVAFNSVFTMVSIVGTQSIPQQIGRLSSAVANCSFLNDIFEMPLERMDGESFTAMGPKPVIELKNVSFAYDNGKDTLTDISFAIDKGQRIALVGESGSGKTTISKLIQTCYEGYMGEIKLFGYSLKQWKLSAAREHMAVVDQEPYFFNDSILNNLRLSASSAVDQDIIKCAKQANAHDFIMNLPQGYGTKIGEKGAFLSVGQRQRLALARAFLKKSELIILDEPTSALDEQSEKGIADVIFSSLEDHALLIIAHRLSTIVNADIILVVSEGRIVERGTHTELMRQKEKYFELYTLQDRQEEGKSYDQED